MTIEELRRALREAERRRNELLTELENLRSREAAGGDDAGQEEDLPLRVASRVLHAEWCVCHGSHVARLSVVRLPHRLRAVQPTNQA
jgi:hypothetical protein